MRSDRYVLPILAVASTLLAGSTADAAITKTVDRKFPVGKYCPLESRAAAGVDLTFVAPASTVRIMFSANNLDGSGQWNSFRIDNVSLTTKAMFDAHQVDDIPSFDDCYNEFPPPGQTTGGILNAPAYDFNATGSTELLLDLFATGTTGWSGSHMFFHSTSTAPTNPATGTGTTGGSLGLGQQSDGAVVASASRVVSGLTPGAQYVLFAWWYALQTSPLTLTIGVPCVDGDNDGFVVCNACDALPNQTCGDCNDANSHCGATCTDADGDGYCLGQDCNDTVSTCTVDCATNVDHDNLIDCRDGCLDDDGDLYGTAGGAGNTCLGPDCSPLNPWCNQGCVDADGDGHCPPGDCQDNSAIVADGLAEINDCLDQQCPGDYGFGMYDEVSGLAGFGANKNLFQWPMQAGAQTYRAVRSTSPTFPTGCASFSTALGGLPHWNDTTVPSPNQVFFYLVRSLTTCKGSYGPKSPNVERAAICGEETACGNAADDDADLLTDCADPDCAATAGCRAQTFTFTDTANDDVDLNELYLFFQSATAGLNDYIFFEIVEDPQRTVAWCSTNAAFYQSEYLNKAPTGGTATSGSWNKWRKTPSTGNAWQGPIVTGQTNEYGSATGFSEYVWCSEQFTFEPQNCIFPHQTNNCEAYDQAVGSCAAQAGDEVTWQLTIRIASTRLLACGF